MNGSVSRPSAFDRRPSRRTPPEIIGQLKYNFTVLGDHTPPPPLIQARRQCLGRRGSGIRYNGGSQSLASGSPATIINHYFHKHDLYHLLFTTDSTTQWKRLSDILAKNEEPHAARVRTSSITTQLAAA